MHGELADQERLTAPGAEEFGEFEDLLDGIGAEQVEDSADAALALKDNTIAELKTMLARLRPLGDRLAATERARLAAVRRVQQLEKKVRDIDEAVLQLRRSEEKLKRELESERKNWDRYRAALPVAAEEDAVETVPVHHLPLFELMQLDDGAVLELAPRRQAPSHSAGLAS